MIFNLVKVRKMIVSVMIIMSVFLFLSMRVYANESLEDVSANNLRNDEMENQVTIGVEMQSENSTIIASDTSGTIKWTIDEEGLLCLWGDGGENDIILGFMFDDTKKEMIKRAKIQIKGNFYLNSMFRDWSNLEEVDFMDSDITLLGANFMFANCENLKTIKFSNINASNVTSMQQMFKDCESLQTLDLSGFDTSNVADMSSMFYNCRSLQMLDILNFDTSNVTSMSGMFYNCGSLQSLDLSKFNTSKVTGMSLMFQGCKSLQELDLTSFDTSNVKFMNTMFYQCDSLKSLNISNFNTSNVTSMHQMFGFCISLQRLEISNFDTSLVRSMDQMFMDCESLQILDLSGFDTSNVTDMSLMFEGCSSLHTLDISNFDTSNVTSMSEMFYKCGSLKSLDLTSFDTSNVENMDTMFYGCSSLKTLDLTSFDTSNVPRMSGMFSGCGSLETLDLTSFDTSNVSSMNQMFYNCYALKSLNLSNFNTGNLEDIFNVFGNCKSLQSLDVSMFDMSKVENLSYLFSGCENLVEIKLFKLQDGNKAKKMDWMFGGCSSLTSINLSGWNTDTVENMEDMFTDCNKLQTLDLSTFNVENVTSMRYMFNNCSSLQYVNLSGFNTENLTDMTAMFNNCSSLQSIDLSGFKTDKVTSMKYMFYGCESLKNLDISSFNMSSLAYEDGAGVKIFSTMDNIETIKMPANLTYSIALPYEHYIDSTGAQKIKKATWYDQSGNQCYSTLTGQPTPVLYYRKNTSEVNTPSKSQLISSFVERMYTVVLNRSAEEEGMAYWSGRLKNGTSDGASLARGFICCKEFKDRRLDDSSYLDVLYRTFFDREADAEGKAYWMDLLAKGYSREFILSRFVNSKEFAGICDSYEIARGTMEEDGSNIYNAGVRNFVLRNYTKALGRTGETEGVEYWSHLINIKRVTALDCAKYFFHSKEFLDKNLNDEAYLETLYATYFDRASDAEGKAYWLNHMKNGMSRDEVLAYFANSKEFKQIMSGYGL